MSIYKGKSWIQFNHKSLKIYFKTQKQQYFDSIVFVFSRRPFYVGKQGGSNHNEIVDVNMMVNGAEIPYYVDPERQCTIIGMPYKGNKITMYVILPDNDIKSFLDNSGASDFEKLVKKTEKRPVIFFLPRMRLESTVDLVPPLRQLGLKSLFDVHTANLSNIAPGVFVNEAVHKVDRHNGGRNSGFSGNCHILHEGRIQSCGQSRSTVHILHPTWRDGSDYVLGNCDQAHTSLQTLNVK